MEQLATYLPSLAGGAIVGLGAAVLLLFNGRIAGISGVVSGLLTPKPGDMAWRWVFVAGLVLGGFALLVLQPESMAISVPRSLPTVVVAGLLAGFGARLGSGCTSGHGICGVSRLSPRSLLATVMFTVAGAGTVWAARAVLGGSL